MAPRKKPNANSVEEVAVQPLGMSHIQELQEANTGAAVEAMSDEGKAQLEELKQNPVKLPRLTVNKGDDSKQLTGKEKLKADMQALMEAIENDEGDETELAIRLAELRRSTEFLSSAGGDELEMIRIKPTLTHKPSYGTQVYVCIKNKVRYVPRALAIRMINKREAVLA